MNDTRFSNDYNPIIDKHEASPGKSGKLGNKDDSYSKQFYVVEAKLRTGKNSAASQARNRSSTTSLQRAGSGVIN